MTKKILALLIAFTIIIPAQTHAAPLRFNHKHPGTWLCIAAIAAQSYMLYTLCTLPPEDPLWGVKYDDKQDTKLIFASLITGLSGIGMLLIMNSYGKPDYVAIDRENAAWDAESAEMNKEMQEFFDAMAKRTKSE